ncbi:MAG: tetratricopeptide repeat protein, partial [Armatimonadetes bacterium]|nr:tetratricopeptide repeat protein [Armatimonadota bacterium]
AENAYMALMSEPGPTVPGPPAPPFTPPPAAAIPSIPEAEGNGRESAAWGAYQLAEIALRRGDTETATERYTIVADDYRGSEWANDALARLAFIQENLDGSGEAEGEYMQALALRERGAHDKACALLSAIADMSSEPLADDALLVLGRIRVEQGHWERAAAVFERLAAEMSDSLLAPDALLEAAKLYRDKIGDAARARARLATLIDQYPQATAADEARRMLDSLPPPQ